MLRQFRSSYYLLFRAESYTRVNVWQVEHLLIDFPLLLLSS
jgi:hypothetical protein